MILKGGIQEYRTRATSSAIMSKISGYQPDDLITELFMDTTDPIAKEMIRRYEKQLISSVISPTDFSKGLHAFFKKTARHIKEHHLYNTFYAFYYFVYKTLWLKNVDEQILGAYEDLLIQQCTYFSPRQIVCGVTTENELITTNEIYPYMDYPNYMMMEKYGDDVLSFRKISRERFDREYFKAFHQYGYRFKSPEEIEEYAVREQMLSNMLYHLTFLINEAAADMIPNPYYMNAIYGAKLPRQWKPTSFYQEKIKNRKYYLSNKGVLAILKNAHKIETVFFKERLYDNRVFMLYKIKFKDDGYLSGYYDIEEQFFYSLWKHTHNQGFEKYHLPLENFVLELYAHLVNDIEITSRRMEALKVVSDLNTVGIITSTQPFVQFVIPGSSLGEKRDSEKRVIPFDKTKYTIEPKDVEQYIRKLPAGANASVEAMALAQRYGYILKAGETFVRPFKKNVYRKKD